MDLGTFSITAVYGDHMLLDQELQKSFSDPHDSTSNQPILEPKKSKHTIRYLDFFWVFGH
jgi:hypothetical protein